LGGFFLAKPAKIAEWLYELMIGADLWISVIVCRNCDFCDYFDWGDFFVYSRWEMVVFFGLYGYHSVFPDGKVFVGSEGKSNKVGFAV
jgi:hypothetical protein